MLFYWRAELRTALLTGTALWICQLNGNLPVTFSQLAKNQKADQLPAGTLNEIHISQIKIKVENAKQEAGLFSLIFSQSDRGHPPNIALQQPKVSPNTFQISTLGSQLPTTLFLGFLRACISTNCKALAY